MYRICAWCGEDLGRAGSDLDPQNVITHGLCKECAFHLFAQIGMPLQRYLDGLGVPIVVIDGDGTVKTANERARALLQKDLSAIEGYRGGQVFECAYARLPGGCGNTIHCSGCTIRNTVTDTWQTGSSHPRVPAYLDRPTRDGVKEIRLLISTEKIEQVVLLRIDEMEDPLIQPMLSPP